MLAEAPRALFLAFLVLLGLYMSNRLVDYGVSHHFARKVAHITAGTAYLLAPYWFSSWGWPVVLSLGALIMLGGARLVRPQTFRGVGGSARPNAIAEINFPLGGLVSLLVVWVWLGQPYLSVLPMLYVGFGDSVTGVVRSALYGHETKAWPGTLAMLLTSLLLATLVSPWWIGALAAVAATIAERLTVARRWWDDNITLQLAAVLVIGGLL